MRRHHTELSMPEVIAFLKRWKRKRFILATGLSSLAVGIPAYCVGLSTPASLIMCAVGIVACMVSGYMQLTQEKFSPERAPILGEEEDPFWSGLY
jgi:uncharacterized membrane protein YfcA